jgi:RNA polymerase sigma factor (sigma-70 family)
VATLVGSPTKTAPAVEGTRLLYERYYDRVFGYCLYQLGSREEAEDATQTTFMWALRGLRRGVIPRAADAWLFTIAKNACRARHRARGRRREREVVSDPQVLADISPAPAQRQDELIGLEDALARMPEPQRRAILLREWRGLSYREIAAELDISGSAVETLIFRARRSLAELLDGKPAPKRARRFAFDFGSLGLAVKSVLGGGAAKLAAGVAAAVVMATAIGGSVEEPPVGRKTLTRAPVAVPTPNVPAAQATPATELSNPEKERSHKSRPGRPDAEQAAPTPAPSGSAGPTVGQTVEDAVGSLPLGTQVSGAVPLNAVTDVVDNTVADVEKTTDESLDLLP